MGRQARLKKARREGEVADVLAGAILAGGEIMMMVPGNLDTGRLVARESELDRLLEDREDETRRRLARGAPDAPDRLIELAAHDECLLDDREYIAWYREWRAIEAELAQIHRDPAGPGNDELPF